MTAFDNDVAVSISAVSACVDARAQDASDYSSAQQSVPIEFKTLVFTQLVGLAEQLGANNGGAPVIGLYRTWINVQGATEPHLYAAWFNLGVELSCAGDVKGSMDAYRAAITLRPDFAPAAINLGLMLERTGDNEAALTAWTRATQADEERTTLLNHQARLLERTGQLEQAERLLRSSLQTTPAQPDVIQHWIHIRQKMCAWPVMETERLGLSADELTANCGPLAAMALSDKVDLQVRVSANWIARKTRPTNERLSPAAGYQHKRIRIGYMSSDFCRHAMSFLITELFERHDRERFEIFGYCSTIDDHSDTRRRVLAAFDNYRSIRDLSDEAAARLIRQDEIDILIDLNGLTQGARLQVLRWRPAPVQATYLGFVGPVPLPELDFLLCDDFVVPEEVAPAYAPRPLYIAPNYQANDSKREIAAPTTRAAAGLPEQGFVFCCFSNHYKITQSMFVSWMAILSQVEGAYLWLSDDSRWARENLRHQASLAGIDPDRLLFAGRVGPADYMARLGVADLFLDTFPYNAGTIASDAIRMRLPLVTLSGEAFCSRMAARLLTAIGADSGITATPEAYVQSAVRLATDTDAYAAYKALFTESCWADTIGDIGQLTRSFEATMIRIAIPRDPSNHDETR